MIQRKKKSIGRPYSDEHLSQIECGSAEKEPYFDEYFQNLAGNLRRDRSLPPRDNITGSIKHARRAAAGLSQANRFDRDSHRIRTEGPDDNCNDRRESKNGKHDERPAAAIFSRGFTIYLQLCEPGDFVVHGIVLGIVAASGGPNSLYHSEGVLVADERRAPRKAGAKGCEEQEFAALYAPVTDRSVKRQRNRRARGIGMFVHRNHYPIHR